MAGYIGNKSSVTLVDGYTETEADAEFVTKTGDSMTGDLSFGDNDKAIFGAGSDLQIYHDGLNSYIKENGTGNLWIGGANIGLGNPTASEYFVECVNNGAVKLYHDSASKLATTSTGIAVTGSTAHTAGDITNTISGTYNLNGANGTAGSASYVTYSFKDDPNTGMYRAAADTLTFATGGSERMRLDSSGNLNIGRTSTGAASDGTGGSGINITQTGAIEMARNGSPALFVNRTTSDGDIMQFRKDGTTVGFIGTLSGSLYIGTPYSNDSALRFSAGTIHPCNSDGSPRDNGINLGYASGRFTSIFAVNGTIQTSDQTEKQDIVSLTATEMLVAKRISAMFKNYRWIDKVTVEGDDARTHTGVIAQEVQAAFTSEGLDASKYGLFCSDTWWEHGVNVPAVEAVDEVTETTTDEDGNEVVTVITEAVEAKDAYIRTEHYHVEAEAPEGATERTRLGIRYPELLSFVAAYNEQRFASIEARLTALEA